MSTAFADVVEEVKQLSNEEKLELKELLDNYLVDERREEILRNYDSARTQEESGELKFTSNVSEIEAMLND